MTPINKTRLKPTSQNQTQKSKISSTLALIIIGIFIVLIVIGYFVYPLIKDYFDSRNITTVQELAAVDTTPEIENTPVIIQEEPIPTTPKGYYIIVGSFRNKNNADLMVANMTHIHLDVIHFEDLGLFRVSAGYFESIHKAYNNINTFKNSYELEDAWVLENL